MPKKSCDLDPIPTSVLYDCLDEIIPIVTSIMNKSLSSGIVPHCFKQCDCQTSVEKGQSWSQLLETLPACIQFAILVKGTGAYCHETVFAAFTVSQPSRAIPICLPKVSQHWDSFIACSKWSASGFRPWLCVYFVTAWPVGSLWHNSGTVLELLYSICVCVSWINPICSEMWSAAGFCSGTSSIYSVYTPLSTVICQSGISYHFFADDSQLHNSSVPFDFPVLACFLKDCIEDVAEWMADSKMNDDKTELMAIGTRSKLSQVIPNLAPMSISGCDIPFSQSVRNLGFYWDETLSMDAHIKYLCCILFCCCQNWKNPLLPVNWCCQQTCCFSHSL